MKMVWQHIIRPARWLAMALVGTLACASGANAQTILVWSMGNSLASTQAVADYLIATERFDSVTAYDGIDLTLPTLTSYDAILFFSNSSSGSDSMLGDLLADYADTGKRLVLATFVWANQGNNTLDGRIITDEISPVAFTGGSAYSSVSIATTDTSGFFDGVTAISGYYHDTVQATTGAVVHGTWSDGTVLVASKGNVIAVNLFPATQSVSGDYATLFANALAVPVPEPSTMLLLATGAGILAVCHWRRRRV